MIRTVKKKPIRFFHCGEYGNKLSRPHHHACLFNFDFEDKILWKQKDGIKLYRSAELEKLWPFGYSAVGDVTIESAAYVARYILKKINGKFAKEHYQGVHKLTGEVLKLQPEYTTMSRRPGIGKRWFDEYKKDVFPKDFITYKGIKFKTPAYYDKLYDEVEPEKMAEVKEKRLDKMLDHADNYTDDRLKTRETVQRLKCKKLTRSYENGTTAIFDL